MSNGRRNDLIRFLSAGIGAPLALAVAGWPGGSLLPAIIALAGGIVGLLVAFFIEHALDWRAKSKSRGNQVVELERELWEAKRLQKILEHRARVAQAEAAISQIGTEVFGGAFNEALQTGHFLPVDALMARMEVMQKAKGLDKPVPPLKLD
jgi:hypothetical protein